MVITTILAIEFVLCLQFVIIKYSYHNIIQTRDKWNPFARTWSYVGA